MSSLATIVEGASSLWERLNGPFVPVSDPGDAAGFRLREWQRGWPPDLFDARLRHDALSAETVRRALGPVRLKDGAALPEWTDTLQAAIASARYVAQPSERSRFAEVLSSIVAAAAQRLAASPGDRLDVMTAEARQQAEAQLMRSLAALYAPAIASEINLARHLKRLRGPSPEARYQFFLEHRLGTPEAMGRFLQDYPVLARLVAVRINQWTDATAEFLKRLQADRDAIAGTFNNGQPVGRLVTMNALVSDPHNGGRTVRELTFESGVRLVYKPKPLGIDAAFLAVIEWLNAQSLAPGLRTFRILDRDTYGWTEFVDAAPCAGPAEVERYYWRSGVLLATLYALGTTDGHRENIIAAGDSPVLVDMETLLRLEPRKSSDSETAAEHALARHMDSVLGTGLLPEWRFGGRGKRGVDVSGLAGEGDQQSPFERVAWAGDGTDRIHAVLEHPVLKPLRNQPTLAGRSIGARAHVDTIIDGFDQTYAFLLEHRQPLLSSRLLSNLSRATLRYLNRPTKEYAMILDRSLGADALRDGANRSIRLDLLARTLLDQRRDSFWALLAPERAALERLDIPHFTASGQDTTLRFDDGRTHPGFFAGTAAQRLERRLIGLTPADMHHQVALMRASFDTRYESARSPIAASLVPQPSLDRSALIATASALADQLMRQAFSAPDGSVGWIGVEFIPRAGQHQLQPLSDGLYGGLSGVALFFAALHRVAPGREDGRWADKILNGLRRRRLATRADLLMRQCGPGGMTGVPSVAYALACASTLLDNAAWKDEAVGWARLMTDEAIESDRACDMLSGVAGAVPALLAVHKLTGESDLLSRAIACGQHVADRAETLRASTGFAHGASGVGYALVQLHLATGDETWLAAGTRYLEAEPPPDASDQTWCNGQPGVALARLASMGPRNVPSAAGSLAPADGLSVDHLCCGHCGRIDVLITAARRAGRDDLRDTAAATLAAVIAAANRRGAYRLMTGATSPIQAPGLFKGLAGIGYTCLRMADTGGVLPSVLLLE